jgi:DNA replication protein DnaC
MLSQSPIPIPNPTPNDLPKRLAQLGFRSLPEQLDDFLARAVKGRWDPRSLLEEMARMEELERTRRSLDRRLRAARIGAFKPIADFDWDWPAKIDRPLIERALTLDFIREGRNLILLGANGLGKTMIAQNLAHAAVLAGFSVLFRTASDLLADLHSDSPLQLRAKLKKYARPALLCVDEVGYLSYDTHAADLLYEVVNRRYQFRSLLLTTNKAFKDWNSVFPNATSIVSLIDRLTHHADITLIQGQSYRRRESELDAEKRRSHHSDEPL